MAIYYPGQQVASPSPMMSKPYPIPLSRSQPQKQESTQYIDRDVDKDLAEFAEFRMWKQQQQEAREQQERERERQQQEQERQQQQVQLRYQPQPPTVMPHFSQNMNPYRQDPGYEAGPFDRPFELYRTGPHDVGRAGQYDLGQMHGLPGQRQMQAFSPRQGHSYGTVTAIGNARVVRGNVIDPGRGNAQFSRQHEYGQGRVAENATLFDGDITTDEMKNFWR